MNREDIIRMAREAGIANSWDLNWQDKIIESFAALVERAVREKLEGQINTLLTLCELAIEQRDELMMQQRADLDATIQARRKDDKA
jgi:hypothetical protein